MTEPPPRHNRILVLGATGGTGRHVVAQALAHGYDVTVFVRSPSAVTTKSDRLRVLTGSLADAAALSNAVRSQHVVISTLGTGTKLSSNGLIARSTSAILRAMEGEGVRRLIFMSAYGVGITRRDVPFVPRLLIRYLLRDLYDDKARGEKELSGSSLDWTLVYPTTLTNGPRTGTYRVGQRVRLSGIPTISRADVADFLVSQIDDTTYVRKGVLLSS